MLGLEGESRVSDSDVGRNSADGREYQRLTLETHVVETRVYEHGRRLSNDGRHY